MQESYSFWDRLSLLEKQEMYFFSAVNLWQTKAFGKTSWHLDDHYNLVHAALVVCSVGESLAKFVSMPFSESKMGKETASGQIFPWKYIPGHVQPKVTWNERDGLLTYIE